MALEDTERAASLTMDAERERRGYEFLARVLGAMR